MDEGDEEAFNDYNYWRMPPSPLAVASADLDRPPITESIDAHDLQVDRADSPSGNIDEGSEWVEVEEEEREYASQYAGGDADGEDPLAMLRGGAGARLLGILGQLSQHLGASSRFARAADSLREDIARQRTPEGSPQLGAAEGSTLQQPEVLSSVGSLLTILGQAPIGLDRTAPRMVDEDGGELLMPPSATLPANLGELLFEPSDVPMPASPASPESIATLSPPVPRFGLDESNATCAICLEALRDDACDQMLQMPCARQHVFHKACLLTWLDARNTCPICRHNLPVEGEAEQAQDEQMEAPRETPNLDA